MCYVGKGMRVGVEEVIFSSNGFQRPGDVRGKVTELWPMIEPSVLSARAKGAIPHPAGSWCNDIRKLEISFLV